MRTDKQILDKYKIDNEVMISNVDEEELKVSLLAEGANPLIISKNLQQLFLTMQRILVLYLFQKIMKWDLGSPKIYFVKS